MIDVAIGIIARGQEVLISRRRPGTHLAGLWEFPGGKCQPDESPQACVVRELLEELGVTVQPVHAFAPVEYEYSSRQVRLHPFLCQLISGETKPLAAEEVLWVDVAMLPNYSFPPANDWLIRELPHHLPGSH